MVYKDKRVQNHDDSLTHETQLLHVARYSADHYGVVNMPPYRASTILFPDYASFKEADFGKRSGRVPDQLVYGRRGTPTTAALQEALKVLEGGDEVYLTPSGVSAIALTLQGLLRPGDHFLVADCVYSPTRFWAESVGKDLGIEVDYFPPRITAEDFQAMIRPNTKLVFFESPGSASFELQDIPALAEIAHQHDMYVVLDNTWSGGVYFRPFEKGVDVSIQSGTKYLLGHSDGMMGAISCNQRSKPLIHRAHYAFGMTLDADTCYQALRGLRTLTMRLKAHYEAGLEIATWLQTQPQVKEVLYPALPTSPDHALWKRDFTGACGLFGVVLHPAPEQALEAFVNNLSLFGLGYSWGGFESLVAPCFLAETKVRSCGVPVDGNLVRIHVGLENIEDLKTNLQQALTLYGTLRSVL